MRIRADGCFSHFFVRQGKIDWAKDTGTRPPLWCFGLLGWLFIDANDLPVSLAAKLDFAGPSVETLNAYRR
jgi:hypothetical protein